MSTAAPTEPLGSPRSIFAHALWVSGLAGLAAGMALAVYRSLLADPVVYGGQQAVPPSLDAAFAGLVLGSLVVLFYATVLDGLFEGWFDVVTGAAVLGQWGFPTSVYLADQAGLGSPVGLLVLAFGVVNVLVAVAVLGNYLRRGRRVSSRGRFA